MDNELEKKERKITFLEPQSLTKRLSYVFDSLVRKVDAFDLMEKRITELEGEILNHEFPDSFKDKLKLYETYTKVHLGYIEALRKVVGQIDMEELSRISGMSSLIAKFKDMPIESIHKLQALIVEMEEPKDGEIVNDE